MALSAAHAPYEDASPSLLAKQPVTLEAVPGYTADWPQIYSHLESRLGGMRTWRYTWWAYWAQLAEFILPRRYHWLVTANTMDRGLPINQSIVDSTATLAMQICAAGMMSGLMSPSRPWFKLGIGVPWVKLDADGQAWLEETEQRVYTVLSQSNFYRVGAQMFQDVATFGTSPMIIYEDAEDVIRCYAPCAGEYYLAAGARLSVDTLYREFTYTVAQIVEFFQLENCPEQVRGLWNTGGASLENEFVIAHAIEPNFGIARRGRTAGRVNVVPSSFAYREVYWIKGNATERPLSVKGFHEKPFVAARWSVVSNDAYGRGPGMDALPDTKQLQQETRRKAELIEKFVRPPMGADVSLKNEPASIVPGQVTYLNTAGGEKKFFPLFEVQPTAMKPIVDDLKEIQARIQRCFFVDTFLMISQMEGVQPRNELEIAERKGEKIQVLGPVIELFETEVAGPAITRVLSILERGRLLAPMPKSLQGVPLKIDYVSMMKLAQRAADTASMERGFSVLGNLTEGAMAAGLPPPLRIVNLDEAGRIYLDRLAFPAKAIYTEDEVQKSDAAIAKQKQAQEGIQATMAGVQAAKGLSDIDVGGGQNAVSALLGTQVQPGQPRAA